MLYTRTSTKRSRVSTARPAGLSMSNGARTQRALVYCGGGMPMGQSAFVDSPHAPLVVAASVSGRQQQQGGHGVLSVATETRHCDLRRSRINQRLLPAQAAVKRVTPLHSPLSTPLIPLIPSLLTLFGAQLCIFFTPSLARSLATTRAYSARTFRSHIPLAQG